MWKTIQDYLGPVPAPVFILMFVAGLAVAFIASAPTKWVERGLEIAGRWRQKRREGGKP
jgi:mannose/fructose/N-acetylgalactosamine-specific phosphotransferase system component IIC